MVDQDDQLCALRGAEVVLGAIPAEHHTVRIGVEDVGANLPQRVMGPCQYSDVDSAVVISVDQHDLFVGNPVDLAQQCLGKQPESRPVVGLHDPHDVGADVPDDHRGVLHRPFVDRLGLEFDPPDPITASVGNHLDRAAAGSAQQLPADFPEPDELAVVSPIQAQNCQQLKDSRLDGGRVDRLLKERCQFRLSPQHDLAGRLILLAERLGPGEQILHIERRDSQHPTPPSV